MSGRPFTETTHSWYYLAGVDVTGAARRPSGVAALGDSLTDGGGRTDANDRYPDELAEFLVRQGRARGVLNAGIGGNRVLNDSPCSGDKALTRFRRDALDEPGVGTVVVLEGSNDIGLSESEHFCFKPNPRVTAAELIAGHRELIRQAHARGIKVIGATLPPFKKAAYFTEHGELVRDELNHWIRTSGAYDAVADLDRAMAAAP
ncbi:GDSL-type esterase/lipase family protein [Spongiactinospora gelatinilytica]|uniref:GDSL-type esterase/lipase family protein n=1 Tax=Spongiactinospora gelatinilytica TaxID=2666298 RepID=UPI0018F55208|nr:GDSL-type esterase/lipase family protein [Spongiactinospora gelatinilytica]